MMTPERWKKLNALFHPALELQAEERHAFLAEACEGDDQLREEVERLIADHERESDFLDRPIFAETLELTGGQDSQSQVGGHIGPYKVISLLGRGGMGEVYLAEDSRLDRRVAIKVLPSAFTRDTNRLRRFEREAKAASGLNHPNILTIHEIGHADSARYIVSEFVEGETLRELIGRGDLNLCQVMRITQQVAGALSVAHASGIIHRDIKPENVMVRPDSLVKVLDFGLAKLTEPRAEASPLSTDSGMVMGTISYMSPEQARGQKVDHRTDIFSLGVMLYEMITGRRPFDGTTTSDVIVALLSAEPPALKEIVPNAPAGLEQITGKCLAKDSEDRYQSAGELLNDLTRIEEELKSVTGASLTKSRVIDGSHSVRRRMFISVLAVLVLAVLVYAFSFRGKRVVSQQSPAEVRTLAVLPLKSINLDGSDDYLGLGIADAIITSTSQMKTLVVRPISSVHSYHNKQIDPLKVGSELQVDAVLDGSVQRVNDHLRVNLNLLRTQDGSSLWAETLDREMKNAFAIQDEISSNVVKALKLTLTAGEEKQLATRATQNAEAYDHFWRGRFYLTKSGGKSDYETAIAMFERATTLDSSFALAHADLALASSAIYFSFDANKLYEEKAYVALQKALTLDPMLARAYVTRANLTWTLSNGFPHERAIKDHRRALEIDPNLAVAHRILGATLVHLGLFDQALLAFQTALRLEPNDLGAPPRVARVHAYQQKYDLALMEFQKARPSSAAFNSEMALTLWHLGRKDEAFRLMEKSMRERSGEKPDYDLDAAYSVLLADAGRQREAEKHIRLAIEGGQGVSHFHHAEFNIACAYALMGKKQKALEWLENTAQHGMPCYPLFNTEPALNSLRREKDFQAFMERMKTQWEGFVRDFG